MLGEEFLQMWRAGNFSNFYFSNYLFCPMFLLILRLVIMFKNQQGQGKSHQWRWKMSKKYNALGCSTCRWEQFVIFGCLKWGMEIIWFYCRRLWRETVREGKNLFWMNTNFDSERCRIYFIERTAKEFVKNTEYPLEDWCWRCVLY